MTVKKLEKKLPLNFTGCIILDPNRYFRSKLWYLLLFKDGHLIDYTTNLCSFYLDKELPGYVLDWLSQNRCFYSKVYADIDGIITFKDFQKIMAEDGHELMAEMDCTR